MPNDKALQAWTRRALDLCLSQGQDRAAVLLVEDAWATLKLMNPRAPVLKELMDAHDDLLVRHRADGADRTPLLEAASAARRAAHALWLRMPDLACDDRMLRLVKDD